MKRWQPGAWDEAPGCCRFREFDEYSEFSEFNAARHGVLPFVGLLPISNHSMPRDVSPGGDDLHRHLRKRET